MKARFLQPQVSTTGLIGHWKLDGSGFDYSLNGRPGVLTGTLPTYAYPGVNLPGTDEHIVIDDDAAFTPALSPFTISVWVKQTDATNFIIVCKYVPAATTREWLFYSDAADKLLTQIYDEANDKQITRLYDTALTAYQGTWIHLAGTYDGGTAITAVKSYLNGVRVDDTDSSDAVGFTSCVDTAAIVDIGQSSGVYSTGLVDDLMLFNLEKNAAEIRSIYEVTRGSHGV